MFSILLTWSLFHPIVLYNFNDIKNYIICPSGVNNDDRRVCHRSNLIPNEPLLNGWKWTVWTWLLECQALFTVKEVTLRNHKDWTNLSVDTAISCMPTLQICSAQPDNQIVYVTNDNITDVSEQDYATYESSAYPSSYRSSSSYELYDASSGSQSLAVSEYASGFDDYGSSYGSAEDCFQLNASNSDSRVC